MRFLLFLLVLIGHGYCLRYEAYYNKETSKLVIHDAESEFQLDKEKHVKTAIAVFNDSIEVNGWASLEVNTFHAGLYNDSMNAYAAGVLEGGISSQRINNHRINTVGDYCKKPTKYCNKLADFLQKNLDFMRTQISLHREKSPYWHQVALILEQLMGLKDGLEGKINGLREIDIKPFDFMYIFNLFGDIEDFEAAWGEGGMTKIGSGSCSALIKLLPGNRDLLASQVTWNTYNSMTRILKYYSMPYYLTPNSSEIVPCVKMSFSGYPGTIQSGDDFYTLSTRLVALETTIGNNNMKLYEKLNPETILEWIRSIVANRLSKNGQEWADNFKQLNSGTYNNQWIIVDYNRFKVGEKLSPGVLTVVEQVPTLVSSGDLTDLLANQTYFGSYNIPYFKDVCDASDCDVNSKKYGPQFSYKGSPRALIFKRDHKKIVDLESMMKVMRYNDYKNDPLSACKCSPPYSGENAISARSDLNPANGTYELPFLGHRNHGATDVKIVNYDNLLKMQFFALSSPTYDNQPAFQWSKSDYNNTPHVGLPDLWKFEPVLFNWANPDKE